MAALRRCALARSWITRIRANIAMPKRQHPWECKNCGCSGHGEAAEQTHLNGKKHLKTIMSGAFATKTAKQERAERKVAKRQICGAKLKAKAERDTEKRAACMLVCNAVIAELPTLASSAQWAVPTIPSADSSAPSLHAEVLEICHALSERDPERVKARVGALERIQIVIEKALPGAGRPYLVGSAATGLAIDGSDLDLTILPTQLGSKEKQETKHLYTLADALQKQGIVERGKGPWVIPAKVPIVQFTEKTSGIRVDICIAQPDGVHSTAWMKEQLGSYPLLRPLILVLKRFLTSRQLHNPAHGGLGSYVLFVMAHAIVAGATLVGLGDDLGELLFRFLLRHSITHWKIRSPLDGSELGPKVRRTAEIAEHFRELLDDLKAEHLPAGAGCVLAASDEETSPRGAPFRLADALLDHADDEWYEDEWHEDEWYEERSDLIPPCGFKTKPKGWARKWYEERSDLIPPGGFKTKPKGWSRSRPPCWRCGGPKAAKWCMCLGYRERRG